MKFLSATLLACTVFFFSFSPKVGGAAAESTPSPPIFGFRDSAAESFIESRFLAVPDAKLAGEHLRVLTQAPHMAGTPEDKATADYVARPPLATAPRLFSKIVVNPPALLPTLGLLSIEAPLWRA